MKRIAAIFLLLAMLLSMSAMPVSAAEAASPSGIPYGEIGAEIEAFVKEREGGLASMQVAVFSGEDNLYSNSFGYADVENRMPADEETVYEWGSCSKLLVWVSVMQLWEQNRIDFDADIRTYLPDGFLTKLSSDDPITMIHLMNHTAGWQETVFGVEVSNESDIVSLERALRDTEPYQAYAPGEHNAYSNWGTALAAFIVECITGQDYTDYVHENIFEPLGMKHTSAGSDFADNMWVKEQRNKLRSYVIMKDVFESFGSGIRYILLYPAGSACGTLDDFTTFAKAFVSEDCPFFEKAETLDVMLDATSYYGDSDIAMNCHGLWTSEYAVQAVGHGGNTQACSSMLQFDPQSGLGVVVMTNEQGETAFNYGIPGLIFGDYDDSERIGDSVASDSHDISGIYIASRSFPRGFLKLFNVIGAGMFMPVFAGENENSYNVAYFNMYRVGDRQWIQDNGNGVKMFVYETEKNGRRVFEMMSTDYTLNEHFWCEAALLIAFVLISLGSAITLLVKFAAAIVKRIRNNDKTLKKGDRCILMMQMLSAVSGVVLVLFIFTESITRSFATVSCILAAIITLIFLLSAVYLVYTMIKEKKITVRRAGWVACSLIVAAFFIWFETYNFWLY